MGCPPLKISTIANLITLYIFLNNGKCCLCDFVCLTVFDIHLLQIKSTAKVHPGTGHEGPEEE